MSELRMSSENDFGLSFMRFLLKENIVIFFLQVKENKGDTTNRGKGRTGTHRTDAEHEHYTPKGYCSLPYLLGFTGFKGALCSESNTNRH